MLRKSILFIIFILICSVLVSAGPFRNISISVVDPLGVGVENAHVVMYQANNDYYNYEGYTDSSGVIVFVDVDARVYLPNGDNTQGNILMGNGPNPNKPFVIKQNRYSNMIAVKESIKPEVNVVYRGSSNRADRPNNAPMSLYPNMLFFFDISPYSGCTYNFIPQTYNASFNFMYDPIELEFVVSDGSPIINLPESIIINEDDNHLIILDLEDYINDFESDFDELIINIESSSWSEEDGEIDIVDDELIINFFPALNLDYHVDNSVTFTISAEDLDDNYIEAVYTYEYEPEYKALHGNVVDVYTYENINDFEVIPDNGLDNVLLEGNEFIAFFNLDENPELNISSEGYYDSLRYINSIDNNDIELDFYIVPVIYDADYGGDYLMDGFSRVFRMGFPGGGVTRWLEQPTFCVDTNNTYGYYPGPQDFNKVETTLGYMAEFTNGLMTPFDGTHLIYENNGTCNPALNGQLGYITIQWDPELPGLGGHGETHSANGLVVIAAGVYFNPPTIQDVVNQEVFQSTGASYDIDDDFVEDFGPYWPPGESTFCDNICILADEPTYFDMGWGSLAYSREPGNMFPDTDFSIIYGDRNSNVYTEVVEFFTKIDKNGKKQRHYIKKGYALANKQIKSWNEVLTELPDDAVLIKYDYGDAKEVKPKKNVKIDYQTRNNLKII